MTDYLASLVRTAVTACVGALLAWLAGRVVHVPGELREGFTVASVAVSIAVYYAVVRAVEVRAKAKGAARWLLVANVLLGGKAPGAYGKDAGVRS